MAVGKISADITELKWTPLMALKIHCIFSFSMSAESLVPYRQCTAARTSRAPTLLVRSTADTAICGKPLARYEYGD